MDRDIHGEKGMRKNDLITVVVPVYNVEDYLNECIESILNQEYENFELILVDDCSGDRSGEICDEYAQRDSRVRVLHKTGNEGLSCARNSGVQMSRGTYICFVDSDDCILPGYLRVLYENAVLYGADVSWCSFFCFTDLLPQESSGMNRPERISREMLYEYLSETSAGCKKPEFAVAWNKLIQRDLALKLRFVPGKWHEDEFYINDLVENAEMVVETGARLYGYRQRKDSITGSDHARDIRHLDALDAAEERVRICRHRNRRLYHRSLKAYRWSIIGQYRYFSEGRMGIRLKCRFLASFFRYPARTLKGMKGWLLFLMDSGKFYETYWR